jgi:cellulose synthase/poly-beta-1,6-N-acetylglucosamine synthase-like glycosyltransferase
VTTRRHVRLALGLSIFIVISGLVVVATGWPIYWIIIACAFVATLAYLPLSVLQWVLMWSNRRAGRPVWPMPVAGRRLAVVITTVGKSPEVVEWIVKQLRGYHLDMRILAVVEATDKFKYSTETVVVPADYKTPNGSHRKMRALHYFSTQIPRLFDKPGQTYICHLDDDSIVTEDYLFWVRGMPEVAGQGCIRLREHGRHILTTLADMVRISDCESYCRFANRHGVPNAVHGEGLVVRADIERDIGWDYGTLGAEDLLMGQHISARGYEFAWIPEHIYIAPPLNTMDFLKQRRRWIASTLSAWPTLQKLKPKMFYWLVYRFAVGWAGFLGLIILVFGLVYHPGEPLLLEVLAAFNLVSFFCYYQFGVSKTDRDRYAIKMVLLQFVVSAYESAAMLYTVFFFPEKGSFDVIAKI